MEPTDQNRKAWDEVHRRRAKAMAGQLGIPEKIRELLPDVEGKHVLHLQCATGESTAELVELGALVSAVDISAEALEVARERAPDVAYVHADVHDLPLEIRRARFDLVYTGGGVLIRLHDLDAWATGIASALKPGGMLFLYDSHPVSKCLDGLGHWRDDYFDEPLGASEERAALAAWPGRRRRDPEPASSSPASPSSRRSTSGSRGTAGFPGTSR